MPVTHASQTLRKIATSLAVGLVGAGAVSTATATPARWIGGTDANNWNNAANWSTGAVPTTSTPSDGVTMGLMGPYASNLTAAAAAASLTQTQGDLTLNLGGTALNPSGYALNIAGGFLVNGSNAANPQLTLTSGTATTGEVGVGRNGGSGRMVIDGANAAINVSGTDSLFVGGGNNGPASGTLALKNGGRASAFNFYVGHYGGAGGVTVDGAGSTLSTTTGPFGTPSLNVGAVGGAPSATSGSLIVSDHATLRTNAGKTTATIGGTGTGTLTIKDPGSSWTHTGPVYVGNTTGSTVGTLNISNSATVNISSTDNIAGTLRIGAAGSLNLADSGSTLNVDSMDLANNAANVHFTGGTLNLAGAINNVGPTPLGIGGTLGGGGTIQGGVTVPGTGRIRPGDGSTTSTFTINGPLNLAGTMQMRLLAVNSNSKIIVNPSAGTPTLTGTIALSLATNYTPAVGASFDLLDFVGTLGPGYTFDFSGASLGSGKQWDTSQFAATGSVSVSATPEPGTALLAMLAGSPLMLRRRKHA